MVEASNDHYVLDIDRARQLLGWEPKHRLRNALPKMVAALKRDPQGWYKANKLNPALVAWYGQRTVTPARAKHDGGSAPGMDHMAMDHTKGGYDESEDMSQGHGEGPAMEDESGNAHLSERDEAA